MLSLPDKINSIMNISYNWLKQYLETDHSPDQLSEILTAIGLEVEGLSRFESIPGGLEGLVAGEVVECLPHPNADKLKVTKVNVGDDHLLSIVCGAPNVEKGQKVIVAGVGTTIYPIEKDPFTLKRVKIRGEVSEGMICAEDEIGLGRDHSGIAVLDDAVKPGGKISEIFENESDFIFDIGLTPNRSDAICHIGVASDLAAYLRVNENHPGKVVKPDLSNFSEGKENPPNIKVEDESACPRYSGLVIKGIKVGESPAWLKNRLRSIGVRPLNNIVDITNYVLHEYGQPLHAFDLDKISNGIVVTKLEKNTPFTTLDEVERKLSEEDLMICDGNRNPLCIAGVFGGIYSGVEKQTTDIFIESAHFDATSIRKSSTRHLLRTDAAKVYEKGSDPSITIKALKRAALLIEKLAGGTIGSKVFDHYPQKIEPKKITLNPARVRKLIGAEIPDRIMIEVLEAMEMGVKVDSELKWIVSVPTNKADVEREADLVEEILRIYGYDRVPFREFIQIPLIYRDFPDKHTIQNRIADYLSSIGLNQMMNLSLSKSAYYPDRSGEELVFIHNTSNLKLDIMRADMVFPALETIAHNLNRKQDQLALYEFGKTYKRVEENIIEKEHLVLAICGKWKVGNWHSTSKSTDFFDLKYLISSVLIKMGLTDVVEEKISDPSLFDYGLTYSYKRKELGRAGKISAVVAQKLGIGEEVFLADFNWPLLLELASDIRLVSKPVNKFPSVSRDLALVLDKSVTYKDIHDIVKKAGGGKLKEVQLFDVFYDPEKLGAEKKSYAINLVFEDDTKTLKDKEVDKIIDNILARVKGDLGVVLR